MIRWDLHCLRVLAIQGDADATAKLAALYRRAMGAAQPIAAVVVDELRLELQGAWDSFGEEDRALVAASCLSLTRLRIREALGERVQAELDMEAAALSSMRAILARRVQVLVLEVTSRVTRFLVACVLEALA